MSPMITQEVGNMKRLTAIILCLVLLCGMVPMASAADGSTARADSLNGLGLFQGTGSGYQLEAPASRVQGLTMLIRLLGLEEDALAFEGENPFKDLRPWAVPYVSYAYSEGYTTGRDPVKGVFDPDTAMQARDYCTFLLRALGYDDKAGDFSWAKAMDKAEELGLCTAEGRALLESGSMTRADMVDLSYAALTKNLKGSGTLLWEALAENGVFTPEQAESFIEDYSYDSAFDPNYDPVSYESRVISTSTGNIVVNVVTVDTSDPRVSVEARLVNDTVGNRKLFTDIVSESGADVVVTANFMESDADKNRPLGHLMIGGEMKYCSSGLSSMGITTDGEVIFGRPSIQVWMKPVGVENPRRHWVGYSVNVDEKYMSTDYSVLYTPSFGKSFMATVEGNIITVRNGCVSSVTESVPGTVVDIPADGYVLYLAPVAKGLYLFELPKVGQQVELVPFLLREDSQGFSLDDLETIVSGGPRVVTNGEADYTQDYQFSDSRFTTMVCSRTAVARDAEGKLLLISINGCTIAQMREAMLQIGCVDCFNTDGGASSAMYYRGNYVIQAGRTLAQTIHVFVDD